MAGCIYHDTVAAEHEDDGKLTITVEQPCRETSPPYISITGDVALSVKELREFQRRLEFAVRAAERHVQQREAVAIACTPAVATVRVLPTGTKVPLRRGDAA